MSQFENCHNKMDIFFLSLATGQDLFIVIKDQEDNKGKGLKVGRNLHTLSQQDSWEESTEVYSKERSSILESMCATNTHNKNKYKNATFHKGINLSTTVQKFNNETTTFPKDTSVRRRKVQQIGRKRYMQRAYSSNQGSWPLSLCRWTRTITIFL